MNYLAESIFEFESIVPEISSINQTFILYFIFKKLCAMPVIAQGHKRATVKVIGYGLYFYSGEFNIFISFSGNKAKRH